MGKAFLDLRKVVPGQCQGRSNGEGFVDNSFHGRQSARKLRLFQRVREDKIVRPVLLVAVLPQGGRDLGPVPYTMQKDMTYDLSLTAGKRARGARFKGQYRPQIGVTGMGKILSDFVSSSVADTENLVERAGGKSVIRRGDRSHQTLCVAQVYSEDVDDETANVVCARNVDFEIKRIGMLQGPTGVNLKP